MGWGEAEKEVFLRMQFNAQHTFYMDRFQHAAYDVILLDGEPVGRLYVDRREDEIRIIDIALLPEHRRKGIGSRLLSGILAEADMAGLPVRIHVERNNPALGLYHRFGFREIGDQGVYYLLERPCDSAAQQGRDLAGVGADDSQSSAGFAGKGTATIDTHTDREPHISCSRS